MNTVAADTTAIPMKENGKGAKRVAECGGISHVTKTEAELVI